MNTSKQSKRNGAILIIARHGPFPVRRSRESPPVRDDVVRHGSRKFFLSEGLLMVVIIIGLLKNQ
jgi:hypothetical protein